MIRFFKYSTKNKILQNNMQHRFAQNCALNIYKSKTIYSFIPKNACSTMRTSIAYANGCIQSKEQFKWIHNNNKTFSANLSELVCANYTFVILRCPYARLASVFLDKFVVSNGKFQDFYKNIPDLSPENINFDMFVKTLKNSSLIKSNAHWRHQIDFLVYEKYDDYFSIENFSEINTILKEKINLDIIDARDLTNHGTNNLELLNNEACHQKSIKEIRLLKQNGQCPSHKSMYSEELIDIVNNLYIDDINFYKQVIKNPKLLF